MNRAGCNVTDRDVLMVAELAEEYGYEPRDIGRRIKSRNPRDEMPEILTVIVMRLRAELHVCRRKGAHRMSFPAIGQVLGGRDHSTVMYHLRGRTR